MKKIPQRFTIGRFRGITIEIDRSWFVLFVLLTAFFATRPSRGSLHLASNREVVFGIVASASFFISLLLHELGHSFVALRFGVPVKSIKFFIFGGLTEMQNRPRSPFHELTIALVGPAVSGVLGGVLFGLSELVPQTWKWTALEAQLLGQINLLLAAFNLVPVFPLDGGRALRAIFWQVSGNYDQGTQQVRTCSRLLVYGLISVGVVCVPLYGVFFGSIIVLIGSRLRTMLADAGTLITNH